MNLTTTLTHARQMASATHKPECAVTVPDPRGWAWEETIRPDPACSGCITDRERALWHQIASEIDAYLGAGDGPGLFGEVQ